MDRLHPESHAIRWGESHLLPATVSGLHRHPQYSEIVRGIQDWLIIACQAVWTRHDKSCVIGVVKVISTKRFQSTMQARCVGDMDMEEECWLSELSGMTAGRIQMTV